MRLGTSRPTPSVPPVFASLATKAPEVFDELTLLFKADAAGLRADDLAKARVSRAAAELQTADPGSMHIIHSALSVLDWDPEGVQRHVDLAIRCDPDLTTLANGVISFTLINRFDLARPYALQLASRTHERDHYEIAAMALLGSGDVADAATLEQRLAGDRPATVTYAYDVLHQLGVEPGHLAKLMHTASSVLFECKRRAREVQTLCERDPDGSLSVSFDWGFYGSLEEEFEMDSLMCARLDEVPDWDPTKVTVHFTHLDRPHNADPAE